MLSRVIQPVINKAIRPVTAGIWQSLGDGGFNPRNLSPDPGDYLLTSRNGDYLTDELGNRLTA